MRAEVTPHTLAEISENYEAAINWVESIGFPIDRSRHDTYRKTIEKLRREFSAHGWGNFSDDAYRDRVCTSLLESRELVSIFRGLSNLQNAETLSNLRHYLKGPVLPIHERAENSSNRARNFGFELYLNALFAGAGFQPMYGSNADLSFSTHHLRVYVEAKRPMNQESAHTSIRIAMRQLANRFTAHEELAQAGIVALDLSKVINPNNCVILVRDEDHLHGLMNAEDKLQMKRLYPVIARNLRPGVAGLLLHYRMLTRFESNDTFNTLKWIGWVPFLDNQELETMHTKLTEVIRHIC